MQAKRALATGMDAARPRLIRRASRGPNGADAQASGLFQGNPEEIAPRTGVPAPKRKRFSTAARRRMKAPNTVDGSASLNSRRRQHRNQRQQRKRLAGREPFKKKAQ